MKRIVCLLLSLSVLISGITIYAENINVYDGREYKILEALNINIPVISDATDGGSVTRAQFASVLVKMRGFKESELVFKAEFDDVPFEHELAKSIYAAASMSLMNGADGKFRPDEQIGYNEAVCAAVRLLGYNEVAVSKGGFPGGFIAVANQLGLLNNFKANAQGGVSRESIISLLYNMLEAQVLTVSAYSEEYSIYDRNENNTLLSVYLKTKKYSGTVEANSYSAISGGRAPEDCIVIDGECCYVGESDAELYLGYPVVVYAKQLDENDKYKTVVYAEIKKNSEILKIDIKDILDVKGFDSADSTAYKKSPVIHYVDENDREQEKRINPSAAISYNGVITDNVSNADFKSGSGEIVIIEGGASNGCDFVGILNYKSYMLDKVDLNAKELYLKNTGLILNLDTAKKDINIYKYSQKVTPETLSAKEIVSIAAPKTESGDMNDAEILYIKASSEIITEQAEQLDAEACEVMLSGKWYAVSENVISDINVNKIKKYYLDAFGCVCAVEEAEETEGAYAYFLGYDKPGGLSDDIIVRLFKMDEEIEVYYLSDNVKYTGKNVSGAWTNGSSLSRDKIYEILEAQFAQKQLIKFALDENNEICMLMQAQDMEGSENYGGYTNGTFTLEETALVGECVIQNNMLTQNYRMNTHTVAVIVPGSGDVNDISVGNGDTVFGIKGSIERVLIYDSTDALMAGVVVAEIADSDSMGTPADSFVEGNLFVVEKVVSAAKDDGETGYKIYGMQNGTRKEYFAKNEDVKNKWTTNWDARNSKTKLKELSYGDVVMLEKNTSGEVTGVLILFSFDRVLPTTPFYIEHAPNQSFGTLLNTSYGQVIKNTEGKTLRISSSDSRIFAMRGNLYICDMNRKTITNAKPQDIRDSEYSSADWAFIRARKNEVYDIVIYRR